jgi:hypothetical protein
LSTEALGLAVGANARGRRAAACTRIAYRLRSDGLRIVGFVPADPRVAVAPLLVELGLVLCELAGTTVAIVDADPRREIVPEEIVPEGATSSTRWVRGALAVVSPARAERAGEVVPRLTRVLLETAELFGHLLVDLTGFEQLGEHATAAACMDALAIVCRAHSTHERAVRRLVEQLPLERFLGAVLVEP